MNLHDELGRVIFNEDVHGTVQYLCDCGLLATDKTCSKCGAQMRIDLREDLSDKSLFRCPNKQCKATVSRCVDSFFARSRLPLNKWLHAIYLLSLSTPVTAACTQLCISRVRH